MRSGTKSVWSYLLAAAAVTLAAAPASCIAQAKASGSAPPEPSLLDFAAGYSYNHPFNSSIGGGTYQPVYPGVVASIAGYFNHAVGLQVEGGIFIDGPNDTFATVQIGPIVRMQKGRFVPWAHALGGTSRVGGRGQQGVFGFGATAGGGIDFIVPGFGEHLAIRPIQADYTWSRDNYGTTPPYGGTVDVNTYRLTAGTVLRFNSPKEHPAVQLGCAAQPVDVFPGDPLTVTASPSNLNPKKPETYTWVTSGGQIAGSQGTASVSTAGLAPGDYTVTGHVANGSKVNQQAECIAGFRVHAFEPPVLALIVTPNSVLSGQPITVTATGRSPQNRPLTYTFGTTAGQISGSGATATLSTAAAAPGTVTVTGQVVDDLGQKATATATVIITTPPPPPPVAVSQNLCGVGFDRDKKRPERVDNEGKGCLDDIALLLNHDSASRLVIVGHHEPTESAQAAAERALNVKQYFIDEKGIDTARIEVRIGDGFSRSVNNVLLPPGASFDPAGTATFDTQAIPRHGQPYGSPQQPTSKKIRKPAN
jgi:outer membrane protein OmpA-like peptidoglycan-associated protein